MAKVRVAKWLSTLSCSVLDSLRKALNAYTKLIDYFKQEEISISEVVNKNKTDIEKLISQCTERIINQNNIFLLGAGTSGRLAVIEAAELYPTYSDSTFKGIIAGNSKQ